MTETWDGRPENPERDGAHRIGFENSEHDWIWRATPAPFWVTHTGQFVAPEHTVSRRARYLGPCLTPAEVAAQVEATQRKMREDAASLVERIPEWGGQDYYCDSCKSGAIYPDREDVARDLRALPLTPSPLADMLAEAERCGMERAAQIAAMYGQGKQGMAASRQIVAAIRAAAGKEAGQ